MSFSFKLLRTDSGSRARRGVISTPRGLIQTPIFMPVGTLGTVKTLDSRDLERLGSQIILGNTYHLMLRPGQEVFDKFGGLHNLMKWSKPILTDSGGFQIFSLPRQRKITEEGALFQSYVNGDMHTLSPEKSIQIQMSIGSDIMMVLDQCIESTASYEKTKTAMEITHRWALRSLKANTRPDKHAVFAIVQGGLFKDLRKQSADFLTSHDFNGFAIGGLAVGESKSEREDTTELVTPFLPEDKPRYLMGVGTPLDLLEAVYRGVDMFDCIIPTKLAQQGIIFTNDGEVRLTMPEFKFSDDKIDPECSCESCQLYPRGYIHHLIKCREVLGWRLLSHHNVHFYLRLMEKMRNALDEERFSEFYKEFKSRYTAGETLSQELSREPGEIVKPKRPPRGQFVELSQDKI